MSSKRNWQRISTLGFCAVLFSSSVLAQGETKEENKKQTELVDKFDKILGTKPQESTSSTVKVETVQVDISDTVNYLMSRWEKAEKRFLVAKYGGEDASVSIAEQVADLNESYFVQSYFKNQDALRVYFGYDQAKVDLSAFKEVDVWAQQLAANSKLSLTLEGYADHQGDSQYNEDLGMKRAAFIKKYLMEKYAISPDRIEVVSFGEEGVNRIKDPELDFLNRRVDFILLQK